MKPSGTSIKHLLKNPRRKTSSGVSFSGSSLFFPIPLESFPTSARKYSAAASARTSSADDARKRLSANAYARSSVRVSPAASAKPSDSLASVLPRTKDPSEEAAPIAKSKTFLP